MRHLNVIIAMVIVTLLIGAGISAAADLRILHINDFHGFAESYKRIGSDEPQGGIAYLALRANELRKDRRTLLLAAGDMIQGDTWANIFEGRPAIEIMNAMGFDAMCAGNHEFDFGTTVLRQRAMEANFPILAANVTGLDCLKPYVIRDVDGMKVGIIGVVTPDTPAATHPANVAGLQFLPVAKTVERYVKELKGKVDIIILLSHLGYNADMTLAGAVKGIDVIIGGHSHTKAGKHITVGDTIIVQAFEHSLVLGVLDLTVESGKVVAVDSRLEEISPAKMKKDERIAKIVESWSEKMNQSLGRVIAEATVDLDGENVRVRESNLGNYVADILKRESKADAAIINGGGLRTSIRRGPVTVGNVYSVLPFNNYIVAIRLTGQQLKDTLEFGLSGIETKEGRFPQVSGIVFTYSPKRPVGQRLGSVSVNGETLDMTRHYVVATNDFLAAGGDGYQVFREAIRQAPDFEVLGGTIKSGNIVYNDAGRWLRDVVVNEAIQQKTMAPAVEGRILVEN